MKYRSLLFFTIVILVAFNVHCTVAQTVPPDFYRPNSPKVIVLLHGATDRPEYHPEKSLGHLKHARSYWGFSFVAQLLGGDSTLTTFSGVPLSASTWEKEAVNDSEINDHFVTASDNSGGRSSSGRVPNLSCMLTYRNGSESLAAQSKAAINQIYQLYTSRFGNTAPQPQIILVGHSMGGNVVRYILTNPKESLSGVQLTDQERAKADFIRDRTLYLLTLATPHEGSSEADKFNQISEFMTKTPITVKAFYEMVGIQSPRDYVAGWLGANSDSTVHLKTRFWEKMNLEMLAPHLARRTDGRLIPIYCLGARSPGREFFDDPNHTTDDVAELMTRQRPRTQYETIGLMTLDYALHVTPGNPDGWGVPPSNSRNLDWVRRAFLTLLPPGEISGKREKPELFPIYYLKYPWKAESMGPLDLFPVYRTNSNQKNADSSYPDQSPDGEIDSDGMVGLDSALGLRLGTMTCEYFDHTQEWTVDGRRMGGSWYRFYSGPWNWDNHGSIHRNPDTGKWLYERIIQKAGPYVTNSSVSSW